MQNAHARRHRLFSWLRVLLYACLAYLFLTPTVQAIQACSSTPLYVYQVRTGWGVYQGTSSQEACAKFGVDACGASGCSVGTTTPYCYIGGHVDDPNWATSYSAVAVPSSCPSGSTSNGTSCVSNAFSALPPDKQGAITVKDFPTQAQADAACQRGVSSAQAGNTLDKISADTLGISTVCPKGQSSISGVGADGVYHVRCFGKKADGSSFVASVDGVMTPEGQAAADAQAAADLAAAQAASAAAAAAAKAAAAQAANNSSSTPPAPPFAHQTGRGWYTPSYNSFYDAIKEPSDKFKQTPIGGLMDGFLPNLKGSVTNSCWSFPTLSGRSQQICVSQSALDFLGYGLLLITIMWGLPFVIKK